MNKLLVILGPTGTGKTDLGISLAKKFNGELISVDSRQVYKSLDIGTGKMPSAGKWKIESGRWIADGIPIHMYDVVSAKKQYTVADYVKVAGLVIKDIRKRGKLPIAVGGTGLYLKALLEGLPNLEIPVDLKLRKELESLTKEELQERLKKISVDRWEAMNGSDKQNPRRLVRAIELIMSSLRAPKGRGNLDNEKSQSRLLRFARNDVLLIGLTSSREVLYKRADLAVVSRIEQGMIEEAKSLYENGLTLKRMRQLGLEYGVLADFLEGKISNDDVQNKHSLLARKLASKVHGFIRRQLTWFKKDLPAGRQEINWFDITTSDYQAKIEKKVRIWYDTKVDAT